MDPDEQKWIEAAVELCVMANRKAVTLLMIRKQDVNGAADIIVSSTNSPELVAALNGNYEPQEEE